VLIADCTNQPTNPPQDFTRMTLLLRPLSGSAFQIITLAVHLTSILYGTGTNTDRTPLVSPNLHIKLYREGKQMPSLAEQKKPFLIKVQLN